MKSFIFFVCFLPGLALAAPIDYVYVYGNEGNRAYECTAYHGYFEAEGFGSYFADACRETSRDNATWPQFPPIRIYMSLDFSPEWLHFMEKPAPRIEGYCIWVGFAFSANRNTSIVIDCRSASMAGVP